MAKAGDSIAISVAKPFIQQVANMVDLRIAMNELAVVEAFNT